MVLEVLVDDREPPAVVDAVRAHDDVDAVSVRRLDAGTWSSASWASSGRPSATTSTRWSAGRRLTSTTRSVG